MNKFPKTVKHLTGKSDEHEKPSCEPPGEVQAGSLCNQPLGGEELFFPVDFFPNEVNT